MKKSKFNPPSLIQFFCFLILFGSFIGQAHTQNCQLPPPEGLTASTLSSTVTLSWQSVLGASSYQVEIYDETAQQNVVNTTTSATSYQYNNLVDEHRYTAYVRSSACVEGPYGTESSSASFTGSGIIIVDVLLLEGQPQAGPANPFPSQLQLTRATFGAAVHTATYMHVTFSNGGFTKFLIWADCENQVYFYELERSGVTRDPSTSGLTSKIRFLSNGVQLMLVGTPSPSGGGSTVPLTYHPFRVSQVALGTCLIENDCKIEALSTPTNNWQEVLTLPKTLSATPNPFTSTLQIQYLSAAGKDAALTLTNAVGHVVQTLQLPAAPVSENSTLQLPTEHLPQGVYFLTLQTAQKREVVKVIKAN
jgi:hypothetical protein